MRINFLCIYTCLILSSWRCDNLINNKNIKNKNQLNIGREISFKDYYENGKIRIEGIIINNRKNGVWKEYDQNGIIQKVEYYYNDSLIHNLDTLDFILNSYILADGSKILLPKYWNIKKNYKQALVLAVKPKVIEPETFNPSINVVKSTVPDTIPLQQIVDMNIEEIKKVVKKYIFKEKKFIENPPLQLINILYFVDTGNQKVGVLSAYVKDKTSLYIITCMAQGNRLQFIKYKYLFEEIILNFKSSTYNARNSTTRNKMGNN